MLLIKEQSGGALQLLETRRRRQIVCSFRVVTTLKTLAWFLCLQSVLCLVDKYLSVFITAESLPSFAWTSKYKERAQNPRNTASAQLSACPPSNTTHLLEGTPRSSRQPAKLSLRGLLTFPRISTSTSNASTCCGPTLADPVAVTS
ncbi:hypothetical protein CHARACLAT_031943 [Characodon lateralis]|uniref:Uncharacterized protein n=1 Tax=Characodon lateralis TaxID=208331 RepID=A0ABU7DNV6_9TELE|nr:hypothetical protein [Characodon lateralis]